MNRFDLSREAKRTRNIRRKSITLREITAPATEAANLYISCYKPVIDIWTEAAKSIAAEYERTLSAMTTDAPADVQSEIDRAASTFDRLVLTLTPSLRNWALKVESIIRARWRGAVLSATGVDLQTRLTTFDVADTVESYINWNTALIRDVSDEIRKKIGDRVFAGMTQRKPAREVAKEIREVVGMGRDRSVRIASDQTSKIASALAAQRRSDAGLSVFAWHHSAKKYPRQEHLARDGNLYSEKESDIGKSVGGKVVLRAPERGDRAGQKPFCGCRERGILVFEFDE